MNRITTGIISAVIFLLLAAGIDSCTSKPEIRALIVTGQNIDNWYGSTMTLRNILDKKDLFKIDVATSPYQASDMPDFVIDFSPYDVVILNYNGDDWPEETRSNFVDYVQNGGGVVLFHAAGNAFPGWEEYAEIAGLVSRDSLAENAGPGASTGIEHKYVVEAVRPDHPVLKGLPAQWMHTEDELYSGMRGPAENMEILATAYADEEYGGTGRNEPVLFTVRYGKGRIFHTVLGHAGNYELFYPALECAGFITTFQRGTEWAATGKVTQEAPSEFPDETESLTWKYLEPMDIGIISERIQNYKIGKSTNCFVALKDMIACNSSDQSKINKYNELILDILSSNSASVEGKKILLKDFSWMATESFKPVYEELSSDPDLKNEALFALERLAQN